MVCLALLPYICNDKIIIITKDFCFVVDILFNATERKNHDSMQYSKFSHFQSDLFQYMDSNSSLSIYLVILVKLHNLKLNLCTPEIITVVIFLYIHFSMFNTFENLFCF